MSFRDQSRVYVRLDGDSIPVWNLLSYRMRRRVVGWLLAFLAVVGHLTALQRFWGAWRDLLGS